MNVLGVFFNSHIMNHFRRRSSFRSICCLMPLLPKCIHVCGKFFLCEFSMYIVLILPKHGECPVEVMCAKRGPKKLQELLICVHARTTLLSQDLSQCNFLIRLNCQSLWWVCVCERVILHQNWGNIKGECQSLMQSFPLLNLSFNKHLNCCTKTAARQLFHNNHFQMRT